MHVQDALMIARQALVKSGCTDTTESTVDLAKHLMTLDRINGMKIRIEAGGPNSWPTTITLDTETN